MKTKNNKGYALLWTVVVLMLGTIFVAGALQLASAMSQRSISQNQRNQAYFTALSVVDTIAAQISGPLDESTPNGKAAIKMMEKLAKTGKVKVNRIRGLPDEMGSCTVEITRKGLQLNITATATAGGDSYTLTAVMGGTVVDIPDVPAVGKPGVGIGGGDGVGGIIAGGNRISGSFATDANTPIYVWNPDERVEIGVRGTQINHMSSLYSAADIEISDESNNSHIHGEIVSDESITLLGHVTVGPYRTNCCDNKNKSFVYAAKNVVIGVQSLIAADITANSVWISETSKVIGNIQAESVTVSNETQVIGNVQATDLILSETAVIDGNVKAGSITIRNGARITGNVEANEIIIEGQSAGGITGNVTATTVRMRSSAKVIGQITVDDLMMTNWCRVDGNVTANKVAGDAQAYINGKLSYYEAYTSTLPEKYAKSLVKLTEPPTVTVIPPEALTLLSKMPLREEPPLLSAPADKILNNGEVTIPNNGKGKVRVYQVAGTKTGVTSLKIQGDAPVLIIVGDGAELTINEMSAPKDPDNPNLFIQLGEGSKLLIGNDTPSKYYMHVWGANNNGAELIITNSDDRTPDGENSVTLFGSVNVDSISYSYNTTQNNGIKSSFYWKAPGSMEWMADLTGGDTEEPADPGDPEDPEEPDEPDEDDEIIWELTGYTDK